MIQTLILMERGKRQHHTQPHPVPEPICYLSLIQIFIWNKNTDNHMINTNKLNFKYPLKMTGRLNQHKPTTIRSKYICHPGICHPLFCGICHPPFCVICHPLFSFICHPDICHPQKFIFDFGGGGWQGVGQAGREGQQGVGHGSGGGGGGWQ